MTWKFPFNVETFYFPKAGMDGKGAETKKPACDDGQVVMRAIPAATFW